MMNWMGGECQRGNARLFMGHSKKPTRTGKPPLHAINNGGADATEQQTPEHKPAKNQSSI